MKKGELNRLVAQARGLHLSIAAKGDHHNSVETAELINLAVESKLWEQGRTFELEKEMRRKRFFLFIEVTKE